VTKAQLRETALARRAGLTPDARAEASRAAATNAAALPAIAGAAVLAAFWPIRDEIDPRPLLNHLAARGVVLALPVVTRRGTPLLFRRWAPGGPLVSRPFGLSEPPDDAPIVTPDVLLVPLAAFDRSGGRIGYGAGHYDATLRALRAARPVHAVGYAFAVQEVDRVPAEAHDEPLDAVVTDKGVILCRSPACAS